MISKMCGNVVAGLVGHLDGKFSSEVLKGKPFSYAEDGYGYKLEKENWPSGKGFEYRCHIIAQGSKVE
jgi:hypothetical protein